MLTFHTELLELMIKNPEQVRHGLKHPELSLIERTVNSFGHSEKIPPIHQVSDELLEEYYSFYTFLKHREEIQLLAEKIQQVSSECLLTWMLKLFGQVNKEIDIYLLPFGYPLGDAFVRKIDGKNAIFVNLSAMLKYGRNADERIDCLLPILEHEVFHFYFDDFCQCSDYWQMYHSDLTVLKEARLLILNEGIAHFIADCNRIDTFLFKKRDQLRATYEKFCQVMNQLEQGIASPDEVKDLLIHGIANQYFDKYLAIPGMLAINLIFQKFGLDGVRRVLEDMDFFVAEGLDKLGSLFFN